MWNWPVRLRKQAPVKRYFALMKGDRSFIVCAVSEPNPFDGLLEHTILWKFELVGLEKLYQELIVSKLNAA